MQPSCSRRFYLALGQSISRYWGVMILVFCKSTTTLFVSDSQMTSRGSSQSDSRDGSLCLVFRRLIWVMYCSAGFAIFHEIELLCHLPQCLPLLRCLFESTRLVSAVDCLLTRCPTFSCAFFLQLGSLVCVGRQGRFGHTLPLRHLSSEFHWTRFCCISDGRMPVPSLTTIIAGWSSLCLTPFLQRLQVHLGMVLVLLWRLQLHCSDVCSARLGRALPLSPPPPSTGCYLLAPATA